MGRHSRRRLIAFWANGAEHYVPAWQAVVVLALLVAGLTAVFIVAAP